MNIEKLMKLSGECTLLGSLSRHNKDLEWWTLTSPQGVTALGSWTNHVIALKQISVTVLFYLEDSRRIHPWGREESGGVRVVGAGRQRECTRAWERERELELFGSFLSMFFSSPWACSMQIELRQELCSTWSPHSSPRTFLWPSSVLLSWTFPFLVF